MKSILLTRYAIQSSTNFEPSTSLQPNINSLSPSSWFNGLLTLSQKYHLFAISWPWHIFSLPGTQPPFPASLPLLHPPSVEILSLLETLTYHQLFLETSYNLTPLDRGNSCLKLAQLVELTDVWLLISRACFLAENTLSLGVVSYSLLGSHFA